MVMVYTVSVNFVRKEEATRYVALAIDVILSIVEMT